MTNAARLICLCLLMIVLGAWQGTPAIPGPVEVFYGAITLAVGGAGYALRHFKPPNGNGNGIGGKLDQIAGTLERIAKVGDQVAQNTSGLPRYVEKSERYMEKGLVAIAQIERLDRRADEHHD